MNVFLIGYLAIGIVFGWRFFFGTVWRSQNPELADVLFYLLIVVIWPYPLIETTIHVIRSRNK